MRFAAVLVVALLAGCSALAPPPAPDAPSPPAALDAPSRRPTYCGDVTVETSEDWGAELSRDRPIHLEARLRSACPTPVELAYAPRCPGEAIALTIAAALRITPHARAEQRGMLVADGAAYPEDAPCPPSPEPLPAAPTLLPGYSIARGVFWNGTFAWRCEDAPDCWGYELAEPGLYEFTAQAFTPGRRGPFEGRSVFYLHETCVHIALFEDADGEHDVTLTIDNQTILRTRWDASREEHPEVLPYCGVGGPHWVRWQDEDAGVDESALMEFPETWIHLAHSPLRIVEPEWGWV